MTRWMAIGALGFVALAATLAFGRDNGASQATDYPSKSSRMQAA